MTETTAGLVWTGRIMSAVVALALIADASVALFAPHVLDAELAATGFPAAMVRPLGVIIFACALLYALPWTRVLGAVLVTGFCGGAICTHFRLSEIGSPPQLICLLLGALAWGGLYLRDPRMRALLPVVR